MGSARGGARDTESERGWDAKKWRPTDALPSTGFSPDSGYGTPIIVKGSQPRRSGGSRLLLFAVAVVVVLGTAGLLALVRLLRG